MAGDKQDTNWPLPKFYFSVDIPPMGDDVPFQEVTGLETSTEPIDYRHGNSKGFYPIKMPGLQKSGNVTLKKGVFKGDAKFWDWFSKITLNTIERQTVTIKLLDETGAATMTWTLLNAWPTKVTGADLKSEGSEVAVESIELAHEKLTVVNK